jgi:hypothetical protein
MSYSSSFWSNVSLKFRFLVSVLIFWSPIVVGIIESLILYNSWTHSLNRELDLQSYLGPMCTAVIICWDPATLPPPPLLGSYTRALLVSQDDPPGPHPPGPLLLWYRLLLLRSLAISWTTYVQYMIRKKMNYTCKPLTSLHIMHLDRGEMFRHSMQVYLSSCPLFCLSRPVFRIRVQIGSGFNQVSGSGSGPRRAKMTHKNRKKI